MNLAPSFSLWVHGLLALGWGSAPCHGWGMCFRTASPHGHQKPGEGKEGDDLTIYAPKSKHPVSVFLLFGRYSWGFSHLLTVPHAAEQAFVGEPKSRSKLQQVLPHKLNVQVVDGMEAESSYFLIYHRNTMLIFLSYNGWVLTSVTILFLFTQCVTLINMLFLNF